MGNKILQMNFLSEKVAGKATHWAAQHKRTIVVGKVRQNARLAYSSGLKGTDAFSYTSLDYARWA